MCFVIRLIVYVITLHFITIDPVMGGNHLFSISAAQTMSASFITLLALRIG